METLKYFVEWTDKAINDLKNIYLFLSQKSETAAYKVVLKIYERVSVLETEFVKTGQREMLLEKYSEEYRYLISGNYKIIYSFSDNKVFINTVFDARQNPKKLKV